MTVATTAAFMAHSSRCLPSRLTFGGISTKPGVQKTSKLVFPRLADCVVSTRRASFFLAPGRAEVHYIRMAAPPAPKCRFPVTELERLIAEVRAAAVELRKAAEVLREAVRALATE